MDINNTLVSFWNSVSPHITEELFLKILFFGKIVAIVIFGILIIKIIFRLRFFRKIKLILKNIIEINNNLKRLVEIADSKNEDDDAPLINKLLKK